MALGDVIQSASGSDSDTITLPGAVTAGNSILLAGYFRTYEGGFPTSVTDDVNAGEYTVAFKAGTGDTVQGPLQASLLSKPNVLAGATTISMVGSLPVRWVLLEVEGALSAPVGPSTAHSNVATGTVSVPAQTLPANSVSFAVISFEHSRYIDDLPWALRAQYTNMFKVYSRSDVSSVSDGLSSAITGGSACEYAAGFASFTAAGAASPDIVDIDTDNSVNQYQQAVVNVSNFTETITSATLGGQACTISENDPADDQITVRVPGGLATGSYDLVISGATETDTLTGVSYTQTHEFTAPYEPVDSNSLFNGQSLTEDSYFRIVSGPANGTLDTATAEASSLWGNDVADIYTPNEGFSGDDPVTLEILYSDATTAQWVATITVQPPADTSPDPFTVPALTNQALNQWVEFAPVTVAGVDTGENIAVSVTGTDVEYAVDTGSGYAAFTSTGTNVQLGHEVKARIFTADVGSAEKAGTLTIGDQSSNLSATTMAAVPQGILTLGTPSVTDTTVSVTFTYDKADQTGFEKRLDGGAWEATISPAQYSGLSPEQAGTVEVRPVNATGPGTADSAGFTTTATPTGPAITSVSVPTPGTYAPAANLDFVVNFEAAVDVTGIPELSTSVGPAAYLSGTGTTAITFRYTVQAGDEDSNGVDISALFLNGGTIKDSGSLDAQLALVGVGDTSAVLVDGVGPSLAVYPLTTTDTAPVVSGSAGDATSLTLVVAGVGTYNPTPSGGTWSQQLPTVALGDYSMTLNGTDAVGNAATEAQSTLSVVAEILNNTTAVLQPVLKSVLAPIFEDVL